MTEGLCSVICMKHHVSVLLGQKLWQKEKVERMHIKSSQFLTKAARCNYCSDRAFSGQRGVLSNRQAL